MALPLSHDNSPSKNSAFTAVGRLFTSFVLTKREMGRHKQPLHSQCWPTTPEAATPTVTATTTMEMASKAAGREPERARGLANAHKGNFCSFPFPARPRLLLLLPLLCSGTNRAARFDGLWRQCITGPWPKRGNRLATLRPVPKGGWTLARHRKSQHQPTAIEGP